MNVLYYIVITGMFRLIMWPSSGWWWQEYKCNDNVSKSLHK